MKATFSKRLLQGFTLLELSVVLVIISLVISGGLVIFTGSLQKKQFQETQAKLKFIQKALYEYRASQTRIPCPADITLAISSANFGVEGATAGTCTGGTPAANFSNGNNVQGMVPTQTLKLPDDYAFDGWGRRIMYAVDIRFTATSAFTTITASDATARMTVNDAGGSAKTAKAAYVLLSMGANGHGAYPHNGGSTRVSVSSSNTGEQNNCDCNASAVATGLNGTFIQKAPTLNATDVLDSFDDLVAFATRTDFRLPTE